MADTGHAEHSRRDTLRGADGEYAGPTSQGEGTGAERERPVDDPAVRSAGSGVAIPDSSGCEPGTGPTNGFWAAADWLFCKDDKWRPVEPIHVKMANGSTFGLGRTSPSTQADDESEEDAATRMQALLDTFGEEVVRREAGRLWSVHEEALLRPFLHGRLDGGTNESAVGEEQPSSISEGGGGEMRNLRTERQPTGSPSPGRESDEQRPIELEDIVRVLSCSITLAELYGRRSDQEALRLLREAICAEGDVQHTLVQVEAVWASLGQDAKDRIGLGFDASRWELVVPTPLITGAGSRTGRLKGYGNAINKEVATAFIKAVMQE